MGKRIHGKNREGGCWGLISTSFCPLSGEGRQNAFLSKWGALRRELKVPQTSPASVSVSPVPFLSGFAVVQTRNLKVVPESSSCSSWSLRAEQTSLLCALLLLPCSPHCQCPGSSLSALLQTSITHIPPRPHREHSKTYIS